MVSAALVEWMQRIENAAHGEKEELIQRACEQLKIHKATLYRKMKGFTMQNERKQRVDAGSSALPEHEAQMISAFLMEHMRKNGKQLASIEYAVETLRANDKIKAQRVDPATGEVTLLSISAINAALKKYCMHPSQLLQPAPVTRLRSLHPNHVWQIDASRCVLYYLPKSSANGGLCVANHTEFYKNKPANQIKMIKESLWRYVITDHISGWIFATYVTGGETGENLADVFMAAMSKRDNQAMHGIPAMVMLDPGSANTGAIFKNLCAGLRVHVQINEPGNPRAKGSVEKGQDIVERQFEARIKLLDLDKVDSIDKINLLCDKWMVHFNGSAIHSRHGQTRDSAWLSIRESELIFAPSLEIMRELAVSSVEERKVSAELTVSYKGQQYDVSNVPNVYVGEKVYLCLNPWRENTVQVLDTDADGNRQYHICEMLEYDEYGQSLNAATIGTEHKKHADTPAQTHLKQNELLVTGADTLEEAAKIRKAKNVPFNGEIDPFKTIDDEVVPTPIVRRGTEHSLNKLSVQFPPLSVIDAVKQIRPMLETQGLEWTADHYKYISNTYPEGVPMDRIQSIIDVLTGKRKLSVVGG